MAHVDHIARDDLASLASLLVHQGKLERAHLSPLTQAGYAYDWRAFERWCTARKLTALPAAADTVALFVVDMLSGNRKTSTVRRLVAGVAHRHREDGYPVEWIDHIEELLAGARRLKPESIEQAKPFTIEDIRTVSQYLHSRADEELMVRDRAILLVGFASALRSASLVELQIKDLELEERGAILKIRREKNDQEGQGRMIGLPHGRHPETCPVAALREWIERRGASPGPLFTHVRSCRACGLTAKHINVIVRRCVRMAGCDVTGVSSHSMRAGLVTEAGEHNCGELAIAAQTGHRNLAMVRRYFRRRDVFRGNVLSALDL